jgi:transcriptional regulator with XRE-family HTH domain
VDIRTEFGQRIRELRARSGLSQELLAHRAGLDRTYISGVERGERNISIVNIEKLAAALNVTVAYMFSGERFSAIPSYNPTIPFKERFSYHIDSENKVLAFQVNGFISSKGDADYLPKVILGVCSAFGKGELNVLVDHRDMTASNGIPVVYSPEVAERAVVFQRELAAYSKKVVALCNSEFMVHQLNHLAEQSGIMEKATHLFGQDKEMLGQAYHLLGINGNKLIKAKEN